MKRTHELKIYANARHRCGRYGDLIAHLWFYGEHSMQMDLDIALDREDVAYVDLIDLEKYTVERKHRS